MSTVARTIPQQFATRTKARIILFKRILTIIVLIFSVLLTAFTVVYVKDLYRRLFIQYQNMQDVQTQLYVDWGKLLLEQTTWSTQSRVQNMAQQRLNMEVPEQNEIIMVQEQ